MKSQRVQARPARRALCSTIVKVILIVCTLVLGLSAGTHAQSPWPSPPICNEGQLGGQKILVCMPPGVPGDPLAHWNGQLVVYAHGYVPEQFPLALPAAELARAPGLVQFLLRQGYAFATTSYSKNGYAVEQARKDLNALVRHFKTRVLPNAGLLDKTLIVGASEGGLITTMMVERYPGIYAGGLAMCGPLGGLPAHIEYLGDFRVVFDAFFPEVFRSPLQPDLPSFGMADVPENAHEYWDLYEQVIIPATMQANPPGVGQLFGVTGAPHDPLIPETMGETTLQILYYSVWGTPDLIATAGGIPYDNQDTWYTGSLNDPILNAVVERVESDGRARAYVRRAYQPTGDLERPLVTLHNELDPAVPYWHEVDYAALAKSSGVHYPYPLPLESAYGHCVFTRDEILGAFGILTREVGK